MRPLCSAGTAHCWLTVHIVEYFDCRITSAFLVVGGWHAPLGVSVVDGGGETPGPIPNPEAKPARADGTAPGREWESRLPPTQQLHNTKTPRTNRMVAPGCFSRIPTPLISWCTPTRPQYRVRNIACLTMPLHSWRTPISPQCGARSRCQRRRSWKSSPADTRK